METVHFTQQTFRQIMDCLARPLSEQTLQQTAPIDGLYAATAAILHTLVDGEVSVYATCDKAQQHITAWTNAKQATAEQADFIVVRAAEREQVTSCIEQAKIGTLIDPQQSATIIIELAESETHRYSVSGPGIQTAVQVELPIAKEWIAVRAQKNREYPLGVDILFVQEDGSIFALPRTTIVKGEQQ
ncbi:MAG: phosphonate C-P lyase system protein PhnH [Caryophanon sp.]|nr:phosphonate C-P lyase system protein PhnH [Caryophanon sp.]